MTQAHKTPGALVKCHEKVFHPPYSPWFDSAKDKIFEVLNGYFYPGHVQVRDVATGEKTLFHDDELVTLDKAEARQYNKTIAQKEIK